MEGIGGKMGDIEREMAWNGRRYGVFGVQGLPCLAWKRCEGKIGECRLGEGFPCLADRHLQYFIYAPYFHWTMLMNTL